jgi:DmsE family decaheme c-type cytochrome
MVGDFLATGTVLAIAVMLAVMPCSLHAQDEDPEFTRRGADACLRCHDEEGEFPVYDIFRTKHGSRHDPNSPFASAQCESCHGPGSEHERAQRRDDNSSPSRDFGRFAATPVAEQNEVCLDCHADHDRMGWFGSAHDEQDVSCASCHKVHAEQDPVFDAIAQQQVCFDCHPRTKGQTMLPSTHPLRFGKMSCTDCHSAHNGNNDFQLARTSVNDTCYTCHAEKRGPFLWEHAPVPEDCSLCHNSHGSSHAGMLKQRPPQLCQQCHMPTGHPSIAYTTDAASDSFQSRFMMGAACSNCHAQVHGSNHPSGVTLTR